MLVIIRQTLHGNVHSVGKIAKTRANLETSIANGRNFDSISKKVRVIFWYY